MTENIFPTYFKGSLGGCRVQEVHILLCVMFASKLPELRERCSCSLVFCDCVKTSVCVCVISGRCGVFAVLL